MKFSYDKVSDLCNNLQYVSIDIQKQLNQIESVINNIDLYWQGNASDYYTKKIKNISLNFEEFYKDINACVSYLQKCSSEYEILDKKIQKEIVERIESSRFFN